MPLQILPSDTSGAEHNDSSDSESIFPPLIMTTVEPPLLPLDLPKSLKGIYLLLHS
jgi:hypothetical protein